MDKINFDQFPVRVTIEPLFAGEGCTATGTMTIHGRIPDKDDVLRAMAQMALLAENSEQDLQIATPAQAVEEWLPFPIAVAGLSDGWRGYTAEELADATERERRQQAAREQHGEVH